VPRRELAAARASTRVDWLPAEINRSLMEAITVTLGDDDARAFWHRLFHRTFDTPIFGPLIRGSIALFGISPGRLLHATPRGWALTIRAGGGIRVEDDGPSQVRIIYDGIPPLTMGTPGWGLAACSSYEALLELTHHESTATLTTFEPKRGHAVITIAWRGRRSGQ
jgi:hypothetical protein